MFRLNRYSLECCAIDTLILEEILTQPGLLLQWGLVWIDTPVKSRDEFHWRAKSGCTAGCTACCRDRSREHEQGTYFWGSRAAKIDGIKIVGTAKDKVGIFSFTTEKVHYYDLGLLLDAKGIALRTGHHCTQPLMDKYSLDGTARLSLAIYNSSEEVDYFIESLSNLIKRWAQFKFKMI